MSMDLRKVYSEQRVEGTRDSCARPEHKEKHLINVRMAKFQHSRGFSGNMMHIERVVSTVFRF